MGTAKFNKGIRYKRRLIVARNPNPAAVEDEKGNDSINLLLLESRKKMPAGWEKVLPYFNDSELSYCNTLARNVGIKEANVPFHHVEPLPEDNGERFFSRFMTVVDPTKLPCSGNDICIRNICKAIANKASTQSLDAPARKEQATTITTAIIVPTTNDNVIIHRQHAGASPTIRRQPHNTAGMLGHGGSNHSVNLPIAMAPPMHRPPQMMFPFYQQFLPTYYQHHPLAPMPMQYAPQQWCCPQYTAYKLSAKKGRPPHDAHCQERNRQLVVKEQQRRQQQGSGVHYQV